MRILLALAWVTVPPFLAWHALWTGAVLFGEEPSHQDLQTIARDLAIAGAIALVVPPIGLLLARAGAELWAVRLWCAACVVGVLAAGFLFAWRHDDQVQDQRTYPPSPVCVRALGCPEH